MSRLIRCVFQGIEKKNNVSPKTKNENPSREKK